MCFYLLVNIRTLFTSRFSKDLGNILYINFQSIEFRKIKGYLHLIQLLVFRSPGILLVHFWDLLYTINISGSSSFETHGVLNIDSDYEYSICLWLFSIYSVEKIASNSDSGSQACIVQVTITSLLWLGLFEWSVTVQYWYCLNSLSAIFLIIKTGYVDS